MTLPPVWKVKREISRVKAKLQKRSVIIVDRLRQTLYDRNRDQVLRETVGARPIRPRIAIFVLFQPQGLAPSTYLTLDHLMQEGWSTVVISNAPLSESDRSDVASRCAHVIERPNVGYDFGAYREGWHWLQRFGHTPDRLVLMNDSTWFPLRMNDDSLRRMEALEADFAGHIYKNCHFDTTRYDHVEAHLLMLSPRAFAAPAIHTFWAEYLMSNSREKTIWRGEIPLSQIAINAGLSIGSILSRDRLIVLLRSLPDQELLEVVRDLVLVNPADLDLRERWLVAAASGRAWQEEVLSWTESELSAPINSLLSANFIIPAIRLGGISFLKKSSDPLFHLARQAVLDCSDAGWIPTVDPCIVSEICATLNGSYGELGWRSVTGRTRVLV
jgi:hypothetical protein